MKIFKILFLLISFFYVSSGMCFAKDFEGLYSVKNTKASDIKFIADFYSRQNDMFSVNGNDNFSFVFVSENKTDYYAMSFIQNGEDSYFYIFSPSDKNTITKDILKRFKINGHKYSKIRSEDALNIKRKSMENFVAQNAPKKQELIEKVEFAQNYDFSDEAQKKYDAISGVVKNSSVQTPQLNIGQQDAETASLKEKFSSNKSTFQGQISATNSVATNGVISGEVIIPVVLQSTINSGSLSQNDRISATLQQDLVLEGRIVAEQGSIVYGTATETQRASGAYKNGEITLRFDRILTSEGNELVIDTEPLVFENKVANRGAKIAGSITGGALIGVAGAALLSVFAQDPSWIAAIAVGAATGAITGGIRVLNVNGQEIELTEGQVFQLKAKSVTAQ